MKKAAVLLIILMTMSMNVIHAEDENEHDENGSIVTDLPYSQEMEGEMYGALFGKVDSDIDIDVPVEDEPKDEETPKDPETPKKEEPDKGTSDGKDKHNGNKSETEKEEGEGSGGKNASIMSLRPNIADANQEVYGIKKDGTGKNGVIYYRWVEKQEHLTIYPALIEKAQEEQKNIVMRVVDRNEGRMHYRLRILYEDVKELKAEELQFEFGAKCEHKKNMFQMAGTDDIVYLLQCEQEQITIPVYIGIGVPESWDHSYGVYQYSYEKRDLVYIRKDLQIDEENIIEVRMAPGKDYVFAQRSLPVEGKNLNTWVSGLSGGSMKVDQKLALGSVAMMAAAGFLGVTLIAGLYMKKTGKGKWGTKVSKERAKNVRKKI